LAAGRRAEVREKIGITRRINRVAWSHSGQLQGRRTSSQGDEKDRRGNTFQRVLIDTPPPETPQ
jgi:hypothetical protein